MQAILFFKMLQNGRVIDHRKKYRNYYELTRVAMVPHVKQDDRMEICQYFFEQSVTPLERETRAEFTKAIESKAKKFTESEHAMTFFRDTSRGMNGIRR